MGEDNEEEPHSTVQKLRKESEAQGVEKVYFITTKKSKLKLYTEWLDNERLREDIRKELMKNLQRSSLLLRSVGQGSALSSDAQQDRMKSASFRPVVAQGQTLPKSMVSLQSRGFRTARLFSTVAKALRR